MEYIRKHDQREEEVETHLKSILPEPHLQRDSWLSGRQARLTINY